jgi:hypothetical protein
VQITPKGRVRYIFQPDIVRLISEFLTQSELLNADGSCRSFRRIISEPSFWTRRTLDLSNHTLVLQTGESAFLRDARVCPTRRELMISMLLQARFRSCRAVDLSGNELGLLVGPGDFIVLRTLFSQLPDLARLNLRRVSTCFEFADIAICHNISQELLTCLFEVGGERLCTLVIPCMYHEKVAQCLSDRFENLFSLTLDCELQSSSEDEIFFVHITSLLHLRLENMFGRVWVIRSWLRSCIQLKSLTLVNWRTTLEEGHEALLSLTNYCPESLELDTGLVIEPCPSADCVARFWSLVRSRRRRNNMMQLWGL